MSRARRYIYIITGILALALGVIGVFLPILPTTPFILLAAWCFYHGSPRFHAWIVNHPKFGPIIEEYGNEEGLTRETKIRALVMTWVAILLTSVFVLKTIQTRIIIILLALIGSAVILSLKTREN